MAFGAFLQIAGRSFEHHAAALRTRFGPEVHDPVGAFDDVHVVLDDHDRVAALDQGVEGRQQFRDVVEMQSRRGFVEDEHHAALRRILCQERRQFHALALAARERRRRLPEFDISQSHVLQRFQPFDDALAGRILALLAEERDGVVYGHFQHVVDRLSAVFDLQHFIAETPTAARLANQLHVGHELHRDFDDALALTLLAASSRDVERECRGPQSVVLGIGLVRVEFPDFVVGFDVGHGVGARRLADGILVDHFDRFE